MVANDAQDRFQPHHPQNFGSCSQSLDGVTALQHSGFPARAQKTTSQGREAVGTGLNARCSRIIILKYFDYSEARSLCGLGLELVKLAVHPILR